jgi:hypothetical protein
MSWLTQVGSFAPQRHSSSVCRWYPERFLALTSHQSAEEPLGCMLIAARLQQNIDDITVLIHGTPKIRVAGH